MTSRSYAGRVDQRDDGPDADVWMAHGVVEYRRSKLDRLRSYGGVLAWIQVGAAVLLLGAVASLVVHIIW